MECRLQLTEVYDIATTVGKEFQHLIEEFGVSSISKLVSTVLGALEHLEIYVEECEKLQAQYYKLLLENDSLASERGERIRLAGENEEGTQRLQKKEGEVKVLTQQVERLRTQNEELLREIEKLQVRTHFCAAATPPLVPGVKVDSVEDSVEDSVGEPCQKNLPQPIDFLEPAGDLVRPRRHSSTKVRHHSTGDALEDQRLHRRIDSMELELDKAKIKFLESQQLCEKLEQENHTLKMQLEEFRAEAALQDLQQHDLTKVYKDEREAPKFYKRDLLQVLQERNELKEEVDMLREELALARIEMRRREAKQSWRRPRSETRVKEILDSFTESRHSPPPSQKFSTKKS